MLVGLLGIFFGDVYSSPFGLIILASLFFSWTSRLVHIIIRKKKSPVAAKVASNVQVTLGGLWSHPPPVSFPVLTAGSWLVYLFFLPSPYGSRYCPHLRMPPDAPVLS